MNALPFADSRDFIKVEKKEGESNLFLFLAWLQVIECTSEDGQCFAQKVHWLYELYTAWLKKALKKQLLCEFLLLKISV